METSVTIITKLPEDMAKLGKLYRKEILRAMDKHLDNIRVVAERDYLIPDRYPGKKLRDKRKLQPSHPTKLTSRTGVLKKMLLYNVGRWNEGTSRHKSESPAVQCLNKTINKNAFEEMYEGTIGFTIRQPGAISSKRTNQELAARFWWDTYGIRGKKRPFLTAAATSLGMQALEAEARKRLTVLGVL
jgi:hypothetical protein